MSHLMIKPIKRHVCPVKTQIGLGICPVWSVFAVRMKKLGSLVTHWAHSKESDQTGWMPRLIWVFTGCTVIFWFCHVVAQMLHVGLMHHMSRGVYASIQCNAMQWFYWFIPSYMKHSQNIFMKHIQHIKNTYYDTLINREKTWDKRKKWW